MGRKSEKNLNVLLPLICPLLGTWPATQACALPGNWTGETLWLAGQHSIHWATPARVLLCFSFHALCCMILLWWYICFYISSARLIPGHFVSSLCPHTLQLNWSENWSIITWKFFLPKSSQMLPEIFFFFLQSWNGQQITQHNHVYKPRPYYSSEEW